MNTASQTPVLYQTKTVILGGSREAVQKALQLSAEGTEVVMALQESCLATDCCSTLSYPEGMIPDVYKQQLEHDCTSHGIRLLYRVWYLDQIRLDGKLLVRVGGKFGVAGILAENVIDLRLQYEDADYRAYLYEKEHPENYRVLTATNPGKTECDPAKRLLMARKSIIEEYRSSYAGSSYLLGRFAARGGRVSPVKKSSAVFNVHEENAGGRTERIEAHTDPERESVYPVIACSEDFSGRRESYDLVIAGGGTAGAMAALAAARRGMRVAVIEPEYALGGTSTVGGVSAYWFGGRYQDTEEIDLELQRLDQELQLGDHAGIWGRQDSWNPDIRATVLSELCIQAGVQIYFGQICFGVLKQGNRICGIATAGEAGIVFCVASYTLDATGDGDLAVFAGAKVEYGNQEDLLSYWASLAQYTSAGTYQNNFSAMMMTGDPVDYTRFVITARNFGNQLFDHGSYACVRESRHIQGKYRLTLEDLMLHKHHEDTLYTCYSNYDPKGKVTADLIYCGALPQQTRMEIPLSALIPVDPEGGELQGMYVLGKAISASHDVFPSIRMQSDLMHQGAVMGKLLADCLKLQLSPQELPAEQLRALLHTYSEDPLTAKASGELSLNECVKKLHAGIRRHWIDLDFDACDMEFSPYPAVMLARDGDVLPLLEQKLAETEPAQERRFLISCELWHHSDAHVEEYVSELMQELKGDSLPVRSGATTCAQLLPDHGVMPELVYDMNALAYTDSPVCSLPFERVFELLYREKRDYHNIQKGIFTYIESFCYAASRNGNAKLTELLESLAQLPELNCMEEAEEIMKERFEILRYLIGKALARNGSVGGYRILIQFLGSSSLTMAASAQKILEGLSEQHYGRDEKQWENWISQHSDRLPVKLISRRVM